MWNLMQCMPYLFNFFFIFPDNVVVIFVGGIDKRTALVMIQISFWLKINSERSEWSNIWVNKLTCYIVTSIALITIFNEKFICSALLAAAYINITTTVFSLSLFWIYVYFWFVCVLAFRDITFFVPTFVQPLFFSSQIILINGFLFAAQVIFFSFYYFQEYGCFLS